MQLCGTGHNVLITGQAGCGKTSLLKTIGTSLMHENKIVAMTASTGIAAAQFEYGMHSTNGLVYRCAFIDLFLRETSCLLKHASTRALKHACTHTHACTHAD